MAGIGIKEGVRAPLFDRLSSIPEERGGRVPEGILDRTTQRASLQRELGRLLNTRSPAPSRKWRPGERTVLEYGLPDYSSMYTRSPEDQKKLASLIRETVEAFEPRLTQVKVEVDVLGNSEKALLVKVSGAMAIGRIAERVSFALAVTAEGAGGTGLGS